MHIFKNVASSLWEHMIGLKDSIGIRMDLQSINRMEHAWPIEKPNGKVCLPKASWILSASEERDVKRTITSFRTPTGYMRCLKGAFSKSKKGEWSNLLD